MFTGSNPVAMTSASSSCSVPPAVTMECARTSSMPSVTSSTLGSASMGYQSLDSRIRLQPIS